MGSCRYTCACRDHHHYRFSNISRCHDRNTSWKTSQLSNGDTRREPISKHIFRPTFQPEDESATLKTTCQYNKMHEYPLWGAKCDHTTWCSWDCHSSGELLSSKIVSYIWFQGVFRSQLENNSRRKGICVRGYCTSFCTVLFFVKQHLL